MIVPQGLGGFQNDPQCLAAFQVTADAADVLLHFAQEGLGAVQVVIDALTAHTQYLADLAQGQVLIVAHIEAVPLLVGENI